MKLYPGPTTTNGPTWFCAAAEIPRGWEWRTHTSHEWKERPVASGQSPLAWVQVRRVEPKIDDYVMTLQGDDRIPVTFGEITHVTTEAMSDADPGADPRPVALAVWWLLVTGEEVRDAG